ncbi:MAG TPA: HAMP domain-containing sensor histidine kinase, partial [Symbiobacteriaceae bacterium]|nr:HAMP domain-containing sensor histidine kinase [Symbiobacteriaceae bacterium]
MRPALPLRAWLIGGIIATVVVAYCGVFVLAFLSERLTTSPDSALIANLEGLEAYAPSVEAHPEQWTDTVWQSAAKQRLDALHVGLMLIGPDGRELFLYPEGQGQTIYRWSGPMQWYDDVRTAVLYQGDRPAGRAVWFRLPVPEAQQRSQEVVNVVMPFAVVLVVSATIWGAITVASRSLMGPLKELSAAAAQVNRGELDFTVPDSRIKEVRQFAQAFAQMRGGLKESLAQQGALEQERRLFVAAMAHDLRTPLTSVRGYLEGIRDGVARTPEKLEHYVSVALEKTGALERLVDGLFNYSRTEYLNQPPHREALEVGALLGSAVDGLRPRAEAKGVTLVLEPGPGPYTVQADAAMLERVVDNLLDNAIRHTPPGGRVTVGWQMGAGHVHFWVQDSGPGIPPDDLEHIFQPTYRA